jgi:hypothetical protein
MSRARLALAAVAVIAGSAWMTPAAALPRLAVPEGVGIGTQVEQVQYRRCRAWSHECGRRWGWGTRRYRRCLRLHGC